MDRLGPSLQFGFKNPFQFFNLLPPNSVLLTCNLGISSVPVPLPYLTRKTRYLSSAYCPSGFETIRLIIGRCVAGIVTWHKFVT